MNKSNGIKERWDERVFINEMDEIRIVSCLRRTNCNCVFE